jgi:Trk K+ transport system NAD-binding subunit
LSLIIAASAIALELGAITAATNAAVVLVAVVTCTVSPILFARIMPAPPALHRHGIILVGSDQRALALSARLHRAAEEVTVITNNPTHRDQLRAGGVTVIDGIGDPATLVLAGASHAAALMVFTPDAESALALCRSARDTFAIPMIALCTDDGALAAQAQTLSVHVIQPVLATVLALEGTLRFPTTFTTLMNQDDGIDIVDIELTNPVFDRCPLRTMALPGNALILGVKRAGDVLVPNGSTMLRRGDIVMVIGTPDALGETQTMLRSTP